MSFEWFVSKRYLRAKRKQKFISLISIISILGVAVGVMALIVVLSVYTGFTEGLRITIAPHGIGVSLLCPGSTRTRILDEAKDKPETKEMVKSFMESAMDPVELGAMVVEGIRKNSLYIITHVEFREELQGIFKMLDDAMPHDQEVPPARMAFEDFRRDIVKEGYNYPVKD